MQQVFGNQKYLKACAPVCLQLTCCKTVCGTTLNLCVALRLPSQSECQMSCTVAGFHRAHDDDAHTHTLRRRKRSAHDAQKMHKTVESLHKLKLSGKREKQAAKKRQEWLQLSQILQCRAIIAII